MSDYNLSLYRPLRDLVKMDVDLDRMINRFFGRDDELWSPAIDVVEEEGNLVVHAEIPGMNKDDIKVVVNDNVLTISGERKQESETKDKRFHRVERYYGRFSRQMMLPSSVDSTKVKAKYQDGVLTVILPKPEALKEKQIEVEVK